MVQKAYQVIEQEHLDITLINATFIKPLDQKMLKEIASKYSYILTIEDNIISGGLGHQILLSLNALDYQGKVKILGFPNKFIEQGTIDELYQQEHLDNASIQKEIRDLLKKKQKKSHSH